MTAWGFAAVAVSALSLAATALTGLRMWLAFKSREVIHAPIADLERKINDVENRLLASAMRR